MKLLKNIGKEPMNDKFRKIRIGNLKIKEAIGDVVGGVELLEFVGFKLKEEGGKICAVVDVPSEEQLVVLRNVVSLLEPNKVEELASASQIKESEPIEPKKIGRQHRNKNCEKAAIKKYAKSIIRIQFPDGVLLQGVFLRSMSTSALYEHSIPGAPNMIYNNSPKCNSDFLLEPIENCGWSNFKGRHHK
ncbi:plant UBX domain-containing protein 2 isoform X1 [Capsicum annuum]|uniref:plant UBX domain-containing protein 2 isoform X1 n=1 Tax=Capsicum annuum TaxID=4072 RepID=UPI0007BED94C|nr:plant UBX domain-containing protein 2 isoform X1 [Capsicum annuum]